jgi:hypothetical protein
MMPSPSINQAFFPSPLMPNTSNFGGANGQNANNRNTNNNNTNNANGGGGNINQAAFNSYNGI